MAPPQLFNYSTFQPFNSFAGGCPKIFSNHWKTAVKFFQSLKKTGGIFQPLENYFPIIGKLVVCRWASGRLRREWQVNGEK
jgi:hypothetical protein